MTKITKDNLDFETKKIKLLNEDFKEDSMRHMTWFALLGLLVYPSLIIFCDYFNLERALTHLASVAEIYILSVSGIVSVFFGSLYFLVLMLTLNGFHGTSRRQKIEI